MSYLAPAPATGEIWPYITAIFLNVVKIIWTAAALVAVRYILAPLVRLYRLIS